MGRIAKNILNRLRPSLPRLVVICFIFLMFGCSTASWIIHHNGTAETLIITEADVDTAMSSLSESHPERPDAIYYDASSGKYELAPDIYKRALRDGIIRKIQDEKIREFLENYRADTITDVLRKDLGTAGLLVILLGILGGLLY
jgi:hypothetical protein